MNRKHFFVAMAMFSAAVIPLLAAQVQAPPQPATPANRKQGTVVVHTYQQHQDEGQRLFTAHCSRCHTAPEGFSPNISGTIIRHMRVRASLSKHEEEELLRFFNP